MKYFLGLDIGTNSVGYAVTDEKFNLIKKKGRELWGVRLFDKANTAEERRTIRSQRRHNARKKVLIDWLQELFAEEIHNVDPNFFIRLENSAYFQEDKDKQLNGCRFALFNDKDKKYTDIEFYKEYKTMYHLRNELIQNPAKDIRFLYLALHHLIKSRGNFLSNNDTETIDILETLIDIQEIYNQSKDYSAKELNFIYNELNIADIRNNLELKEKFKEEFKKITSGKLDLHNKAIGNLINSKSNVLIDGSVDTSDEHTQNIELATVDIDNLNNNQIKKKYLSKKEIKENLQMMFKLKSNTTESIILNALIDGKISTKIIFKTEIKELNNKSEIDLSNADKYKESIEIISNFLSEEQLEIIDKIKLLHDTIILDKITNGKDYICQSMVDRYKKHKSDLKLLKKVIKEAFIDGVKLKEEIFRKPYSKEYVTYSEYVGRCVVKGKKYALGVDEEGKDKSVSRDSFLSLSKDRKSILDLLKDESKMKPDLSKEIKEQIETIKKEIEDKEFLPKLRVTDNSVIPNTLIKKELKKILQVNSEKYKFLNDKDSQGLTMADKIESIIKFRVPYYVGPISSRTNDLYKDRENTNEIENKENIVNGGGKDKKEYKNQWTKINKDIPYRPWNIDRLVNYDQAEEEFIQRMLNKCTYMKDKYVLPKNSILFSKYCVLNELNKIKINGEGITVEQKQSIYTNLFLKERKVTLNKLKKFLKLYYNFKEEDVITGIDKEFNSSMATYIKFKEKNYDDIELIEDIIKYSTIFNNSETVIKRIKKDSRYKYLNDSDYKYIKSLNFSSWGRLSKEFLEMKFFNKNTNRETTIIDELWETNQNLQEIIYNDKYTIKEQIERQNKKEQREVEYEDIESLYCSPGVKRGVWQTVLMIKELKKLLGDYPEYIFVEANRWNDKKEKKESRKDKLLALYKTKEFWESINNDTDLYNQLQEELKDKDNSILRSDKYYLYFLQGGICAYTGERIKIEQLATSEIYDIDHIIPRSYKYDDSLDNKVLVLRTENIDKRDIYPIPTNIVRNGMKDIWKKWQKAGLISQEKFNRLSRTNELSAEDKAGFVNRQLVETNQSVKAVADLLRQFVVENNRVVFSKSSIVSAFRQKFNIYKCREINDLHHARDAYLNIVCGYVTKTRYTDNPVNFFKKRDEYKGLKNVDGNLVNENEQDNYTTNPLKIFEGKVYNHTTNELVWDGTGHREDKSEYLNKVKKTCELNYCLISRKTEYRENYAFYDETRYKSTKNLKRNMKDNKELENELVPLKGKGVLSNTYKYGGYKSVSNAYLMLIKSTKKGKDMYSIEGMTSYALQQIKINAFTLEDYLTKKLGLENPVIVVDRIPMYSEILYGSGSFLISGTSGKQLTIHNFNQWFANSNKTLYAKYLIKYQELEKVTKFEDDSEYVVISKAKSKNNEEIALTKGKNIDLYKEMIKFYGSKYFNEVNNVSTFLNENLELFESLSVLTEAKILLSLLNNAKSGSISIDLRSLNGKGAMGVIFLSRNLTGKNITLIKKSPLGFITKRIRLDK